MARKILLADDSVTAQNMGRRILTDAGYEVVTVNNGSAALKKMAEQAPDLIVLDVYMPGYSGLEVCQRVKENRETARIPVLLTVGKLEPFKPEEARRVKADAYIVKPFEASELLTALTKLEDKIVPQPESYKPGRFAKAIASVGGTGDGFGDSETGWKDRLVIPPPVHKLHEAEPEAAQAPVSASHVLERPADFKPAEPRKGFERPLPAGLPQDITPEEIAAITAAAATISGTAPEVRATEPEEQPAASVATSATVPLETAPATPALAAEESSSDEPSATFASVSSEESRSESEAQPAVEAAGVETVPEASPSVSNNGTETQPSAAAETVPEPVAEASVPAHDDEVMAAVSALGGDSSSNGNGHSNSFSGEQPPSHIAATCAELAAAQAVASGPRWVAEAVAVSDEESTFMLEKEMEQAYATFAARSISAPAENASAVAIAEPLAEAVSEAVTPIESTYTPAAPDTVAAMEEPVAIESTQVDEQAAEVSSATQSYSEPPASVSAEAELVPVAESAPVDAVATVAQDSPAESSMSAPVEESISEAREESAYAAAASASSSVIESPAAEPVAHPGASQEPEAAAATEQDEHVREAELAAAWANWHQIRESIVGTQIAVPITDGEPGHLPPPVEEAIAQLEPVAQTVPAEQAESSLQNDPSAHTTTSDPEFEVAAEPAEETAEEPEAISSIVDGMLAELKPKLMEELSRKLAKEKKKKK